MSRKALGAGLGLSALVPSAPAKTLTANNVSADSSVSGLPQKQAAETAPQEIEIARIAPNRYQPRQTFDVEALETLAQSIKRHGVMQPILVRSLTDTPGFAFELIAGERRMRAAALCGLAKIPAIVKEIGNNDAMEYALIENLQREDLNPIEKARAYARLLSEFSCTQEEVAERVGVERSSVTNTLRLLNLPGSVQNDITQGTISMGHAKILLGLDAPILQMQMAEQVKARGLSVRQLTARVENLKKKPASPKSASVRKAPELAALERRLLHALGTKVELIPQGAGGEIKITYYSLDDLDRILEIVGG